MRSIKDLVDLKNAKQEIFEQSRQHKINLENMENEKVIFCKKICTNLKFNEFLNVVEFYELTNIYFFFSYW